MSVVNFTEYYLRHPDRLEKLESRKVITFWNQRHWHPVVKMRWVASIQSTGEGMLTYPDGTKQFYNGLSE